MASARRCKRARVALGLLTIISASSARGWAAPRKLTRRAAAVPSQAVSYPSTTNCTERWITQPLDHLSCSKPTPETFSQRYYVYDRFWDQQRPGPIFFYCGNEADVGNYVNSSGLIWENAPAFGAYIVFAEHRFYGASQPSAQQAHAKTYLSHELALADYAALVSRLRAELGAEDSPVIAFGGSYGGKLAAWFRMKYPAAVAGAISASAPLLMFDGQVPQWDSQTYYQVVTNTARYYSEECPRNVHAAFELIWDMGATQAGRDRLQNHFRLCSALSSQHDVDLLRLWLRDAFDEFAVGNYPWPTNYIAGTLSNPMPAWPMREACSSLSAANLRARPSDLFAAVREAVAVVYNLTGAEACFEIPTVPTPLSPAAGMDDLWDWQWCTETLPDSYWFATNGDFEVGGDMFWPNPYNQTLVDEHCRLAWGVEAQTHRIVDEYGGRYLGAGHSNIVFSSGSFDAWSSGSVARNLSDSLVVVLIEGGGHHLDLMFSHPDDPASVVAARQLELAHIRRWVEAFRAERGARAVSWGDLLAAGGSDRGGASESKQERGSIEGGPIIVSML